MPETMRDAALEYLRRGFRPIPVHYIAASEGWEKLQDEIGETLASGLESGMEQPRDLSEIGKMTRKTRPVTVPDGELPTERVELWKIYNPARDADGGNSERLLAKARHLIRYTREMGCLISVLGIPLFLWGYLSTKKIPKKHRFGRIILDGMRLPITKNPLLQRVCGCSWISLNTEKIAPGAN